MATLNDNCLFGVENKADTVLTWTGGSVSAPMPLSNLAKPDVSYPYRTAGIAAPTFGIRDLTAGTTWIEIDIAAGGVEIQLIALIKHNFTAPPAASATVRFQLSNSSTFSPLLYDSGTLGTGGQAPGTGFFHAMTDAITARYLRIELRDVFNTKGFIQIGRLYVGPIYQPSINMNLDWSIGYEDPSEFSRALGGNLFFDERTRYRVANFTLGHMPESEALDEVFNLMDRVKGTVGDIVFIAQPLKPLLFGHEALYCRQRKLDPLRMPYVDSRRDKAFELEELR